MARRNKRKGKSGFVFPAPFACAAIVASTFALVYVWLGCQCEAVGREIKQLERQKVVLGKKYLNEVYKWTRMKSPRNVENALKRHSIVMTWPRRDQILRLSDMNASELERFGQSEPGRALVALRSDPTGTVDSERREWQGTVDMIAGTSPARNQYE